MSFRFEKWTGPLFAGLILCLSPLVQAQPGDSGQQIIFSTPDGKTVPNAPLPATQAPQPEELSSFQSDFQAGSPFSSFDQQLPGASFSAPAPTPIPRDSMQNSRDERERMGLLTPAEIMHVPTMEQIFGLPERNTAADSQTNLMSSENQGTTNILSSDESSSLESSWQKIFNSNSGANASTNESIFDSRTTNDSSGILTEIFNNPRDKENNSLFGAPDGNAGGTAFGVSQQSDPNSFSSTRTATANTAYYSSTFNSGPNSQSPFAVPKTSTMDPLPQLPRVPTVSGQDNNNNAPQPTPSWAPKPPPWLSPVSSFGNNPAARF